MKPAIPSMARNPVSSEAGFTLIELMQSIVFLSLGLLALSSLTIGTVRGNLQAKQITAATIVAQDKIEELRASGYANVVSGSDQILAAGVAYDRKWTVCADCIVAGTKQVTVSVAWVERSARTLRLRTMIGS